MPVNIPVQNWREVDVIDKIMTTLRESDFNKDGGYTKEELKHAVKNLGSLFPAWRTYRCFGKADTNHDGQISGEEIDTLVEDLFSHGFGRK